MDLSFFDFPFMQRALLAGAVTGIVCSTLGVFIVLRGLAFLGDGIAHAAFAGVALGLVLSVPPIGAAFVFCALFALFVGYFSRMGKVREDTTIGIFFSASLALGLILIGLLKNRAVNVMEYLFGGVLTISSEELLLACIVSAVVLGIVFLLYKEFLLITFDAEFAARSGFPAELLGYLLLLLMSVTIVSSVRLVGVILVSSLLVTPAATALQLSRKFSTVLLLSALIGLLSTQIGIIASFYLDTPPGATIVLVATLGFIIASTARGALSAQGSA